MRVMSQSPDPLARMHTMTKRQGKSGTIDVKALLAQDEEFLRALVRTALQEVLEAEMTEALGAEKGERAAGRQGYRSGYYGRRLCHGNSIEHALRAKSRHASCRCDGLLPLCSSFGSEDPQCGSGDEVALKVEGVLNSGV